MQPVLLRLRQFSDVPIWRVGCLYCLGGRGGVQIRTDIKSRLGPRPVGRFEPMAHAGSGAHDGWTNRKRIKISSRLTH